jgi:hypothetical protein
VQLDPRLGGHVEEVTLARLLAPCMLDWAASFSDFKLYAC